MPWVGHVIHIPDGGEGGKGRAEGRGPRVSEAQGRTGQVSSHRAAS